MGGGCVGGGVGETEGGEVGEVERVGIGDVGEGVGAGIWVGFIEEPVGVGRAADAEGVEDEEDDHGGFLMADF